MPEAWARTAWRHQSSGTDSALHIGVRSAQYGTVRRCLITTTSTATHTQVTAIIG